MVAVQEILQNLWKPAIFSDIARKFSLSFTIAIPCHWFLLIPPKNIRNVNPSLNQDLKERENLFVFLGQMLYLELYGILSSCVFQSKSSCFSIKTMKAIKEGARKNTYQH